jgi:hypothetical protein
MVTEYEEIGQTNDNDTPGCLLAFDSSGRPSDQTWGFARR